MLRKKQDFLQLFYSIGKCLYLPYRIKALRAGCAHRNKVFYHFAVLRRAKWSDLHE